MTKPTNSIGVIVTGAGLWQGTRPRIEVLLDGAFGAGQWAYDAQEKVYVGRDPQYTGDGFGFIAVRPDRTWYRGEIEPGNIH